MKVTPILSDDKKVYHAGLILKGMVESATNAVIFRDTPEVWFQFYLGLYLEKPTFVLIQKEEMTKEIEHQLNYPSVKKVVVSKLDKEAIVKFSENLNIWVKR